jgi:hypothetical protein
MDDKQETLRDNQMEQEGIKTPTGVSTPHSDVHNVEAEKGLEAATLEDGPAQHLTPEHREYLLSRHKTLDLVPLPTMDPADPLNWPAWKVWILSCRGVKQG